MPGADIPGLHPLLAEVVGALAAVELVVLEQAAATSPIAAAAAAVMVTFLIVLTRSSLLGLRFYLRGPCRGSNDSLPSSAYGEYGGFPPARGRARTTPRTAA